MKLSIRDLVLAAAIIVLAAGWWLDHQRVNRLSEAKLEAKWEYQVFPGPANTEMLNYYAGEGWETVIGDEKQIIFRRPKR